MPNAMRPQRLERLAVGGLVFLGLAGGHVLLRVAAKMEQIPFLVTLVTFLKLW
jgi:hypothetical protein